MNLKFYLNHKISKTDPVPVTGLFLLTAQILSFRIRKQFSTTPLIRINWDREPSGYEENPDDCVSL